MLRNVRGIPVALRLPAGCACWAMIRSCSLNSGSALGLDAELWEWKGVCVGGLKGAGADPAGGANLDGWAVRVSVVLERYMDPA